MSVTCLINETCNHSSLLVDEPTEVPNLSSEHLSTLEHEPTNGMDHSYLCAEENSMVPSQLVCGLSLNKPIPSQTGSSLTVCGYGSWQREKLIDKSINMSVLSCKPLSLPTLEHESQPSKALLCTKGSMMPRKLLVRSSKDSLVNDETGSTLFACECGSWQRPIITDVPEADVAYYETDINNETTLLPTLQPFTSPSESQMN